MYLRMCVCTVYVRMHTHALYLPRISPQHHLLRIGATPPLHPPSTPLPVQEIIEFIGLVRAIVHENSSCAFN
jgi:hypothetical protein